MRAALAIFSFVLFSCNFEEDKSDFFDKNGFAAEFRNIAYSSNFVTDSSGVMNVSPADDFIVYYTVENLKGYDIQPVATFATSIASSNYTIAYDSELARVTLTYKKSFLADVDGTDAKDISPTIKLINATEAKNKNLAADAYTELINSEDYQKSHTEDSKALTLRCNAVPNSITNAVGQMYSETEETTDEEGNTIITNTKENILVIALDMPELKNDDTLLTVYETRKKKTHYFSISAKKPKARTGESWTISDTAPDGLGATATDGTEFITEGGTPYYITTDIENIQDEDVFSLTFKITDADGLTSKELTISSHEKETETAEPDMAYGS